MKRVKTGLIGCGTVTLKAHLPALMNGPSAGKSSHLFQIVAICGLDNANLEHIRSILPQVEVFSDYLELLEHSDCEAVLVATGEQDHPAICRAALERGKYVLCEKPLAVNAAVIRDTFCGLDDKMIHKLQVAFNKRFHPVYLAYEDLKAKGELGNITAGSFDFVTQQGSKPGWDGMLSNLIHYCDLVCSIMGEVGDLCCFSNNNENGNNLSVSLRSVGGSVANLFFTSAASWNAGFHEEWQLVDDKRNRLVSRNCNESFFFRHGAAPTLITGSNSVFWLPDAGGYKTQLSSFYDLVCGNRELPKVGLSEALLAHELFERIKAETKGQINA